MNLFPAHCLVQTMTSVSRIGDILHTITVSLFVCCLTILLRSDTCYALLCAQCSSATLYSCEQTAPVGTPCQDTVGVNCMIARKQNTTGDQLEFIRGCTMVRVGRGCMDGPHNTSLCYVTCDVDNCNLSAKHALSPLILAACIAVTNSVAGFLAN